MEELKKLIRDIPDFPKKGIVFKDITPLLKDADALDQAMNILKKRYEDKGIKYIVGIDARGFIFGSILANKLGIGFIPIRKPGKLPADTIQASYELEYGKNTIEIHKDAMAKGDKIVLIDDLLATGGTVNAATSLIEKLEGNIVEITFIIELAFLKGREKLKNYNVFSLLSY